MSEIVIVLPKADGIGEDISDTRIEFTMPLPRLDTLTEWDRFADKHAEVLEATLLHALPGAIYDGLLGRMFARRASHFRVAFEPSMDTKIVPV